MSRCCCSNHRPLQTFAVVQRYVKIDNHRRLSGECWCWCELYWISLCHNEWTRRECLSHFHILTHLSSACYRKANNFRDFPFVVIHIRQDHWNSCCDNKFQLHALEYWFYIRHRFVFVCNVECFCTSLFWAKEEILEISAEKNRNESIQVFNYSLVARYNVDVKSVYRCRDNC